MKTFGSRLKAAREQAGFKSAQQFAGVLGLEPHAYRKYERGQSEPNFDVLTRICELLQVTPNHLLPVAARADRDGSSNATPPTTAAA
jgi:transcriptional regulator with XRE-family HTH domain